MLFAYANVNHKNAVKLSLTDEVPAPGSRAAHDALGGIELSTVAPTVSSEGEVPMRQNTKSIV